MEKYLARFIEPEVDIQTGRPFRCFFTGGTPIGHDLPRFSVHAARGQCVNYSSILYPIYFFKLYTVEIYAIEEGNRKNKGWENKEMKHRAGKIWQLQRSLEFSLLNQQYLAGFCGIE